MKYKDKFTEINYWEIDYQDFEKIVKETYDVKDYCFVADIEGNNDSEHSFSTDDSFWDSYEENQLKDFIETKKGQYMAGKLIVDLARKELIPKGNLLINVCW